MEIRELMSPSGIRLGVGLQSKDQVLRYLASLAVSSGAVTDEAAFLEALRAREKEGSTDFGRGLAVPHAQGPFTGQPLVMALTIPGGVAWGGPNDARCDVVFCIAAPKKGGEYMEVLACLMTALRYPGLGDELRAAYSREQFLDLLVAAECSARCENTDQCCPLQPRILAVTACPTGIAHTYLAADALKKAADALGVPIKVETNGSIGIQNALTEQDIKNCDAVIVAVDKKVEVDRFAGKRVIFTSVTTGVYHAQQLVKRAAAGEAPVFRPGTDLMAGESLPSQGEPQGLYRHLMNGVSHMLPFVVAGGVLMTLGLMLDDYQIDPAQFGLNLPLPAFFTLLGQVAFGFMLPVAAGYIAESIAGLPGLAVGCVGGALAAHGINFADLTGVMGESVILSEASSGFLGAMLAGFLAGYVIRGLQALTRRIPASLASIKPSLIYPVAGVLVVGVVICVANPLLAQLNHAIDNALKSLEGGSRAAFGAVLGSLMALDMGGPVNKTTFLFATAALRSGDLDVMAAVMAGGMVPPLAMAVATSLFPHSFSPSLRRSGMLGYVLGLSFITEGAIPFVIADPLRAIPCCMFGGALAGGLSMAFGCRLGAPQGGVFVLPLMNHPLLFLLALAVASLAGGLLYGLLRKLAAARDPGGDR